MPTWGWRRPTATASGSAGTDNGGPPGRYRSITRLGATSTCATSRPTSSRRCSSRTSGRRRGRRCSRPTATRSATGSGCSSTTASSTGSPRCAASCSSRSSRRCSTASRIDRLRDALLSRPHLRPRVGPAGCARAGGRVRRGDRARARRSSTPIQMTVGISDGEHLWAVRYSTEGKSRSLFVSEDADALRKLIPTTAPPAVHRRGSCVVSEPPGDLPGAWLEIPVSTAMTIQPGPDEQRPFQPAGPDAVSPMRAPWRRPARRRHWRPSAGVHRGHRGGGDAPRP